MFAWEVDNGSIDGVDVTGRRAVSISQHAGHRDDARQRVLVFVDDAASVKQAEVLAAALTGGLGGPLRELSDLLGELLSVEMASIALERQGHATTLKVGRRIHVESTSLLGPSGEPMTLTDGCLSVVLGSPVEVGVSRRFRAGFPAHGIDLDLRGRSTTAGRFAYEHTPVV